MTATSTIGFGICAPANPSPDDRDEMRLLIALAWVNARDCVGRVFDQHLVANPGWDVLLDLYINQVRGRPVFVCGLCLAAQVPQTTALRLIGNLEKEGLVYRMPDTHDRRRTFVYLSDTGLARMREVLDATSESDRRAGVGRLQTVQ